MGIPDLSLEIQKKLEAFAQEIAAIVREDCRTRTLAVYEEAPVKLPPKRPRVKSRPYVPITYVEKNLVEALREHPGSTSWDLAGKLDRGETTVRTHLKKLVSRSAVRREIDGQRVRFYAN